MTIGVAVQMRKSGSNAAVIRVVAILLVGGCSVDLGKLRAPARKDSGASLDRAPETNAGTGESPDLGSTPITPVDVAAPADHLWSPNEPIAASDDGGVLAPDGASSRDLATASDLPVGSDGASDSASGGASDSLDESAAVADAPPASEDTDEPRAEVEPDLPLAGTGGAGGSSRDGSADLASGGKGGGSAATTGGATGKGGTVGTGGGGSGGNTSVDAGGVCLGRVGVDAGGGLTQGLVAYYSCESASKALLPDQSGNGKDATLLNGAGVGGSSGGGSGGSTGGSTGGSAGYSFGVGEVNKALYLAAANQGYAALPAGLLATACEATVATWVYVNSSVGWQRIFDFGKDENVYMYLTPLNTTTKVMRFAISLGGYASAYQQSMDGQAELSPGVWNHVAVVLGPSGGSLYVNGALVGANTAMTLRPADLGNTPNNWIGRSQFSRDPFFDGSIDDFRVYDRALSPAEVQALASPQ